ncbi:hypothetical protein HYW19_00270 [Candidatus Woesearchaeota archaeon]|nr:hypothetical protein [Candidatus Woesearchaeota archaeon]
MIKKRSQISGTVFVYIFSAIIIAVILIFGYKSIIKTKEKVEQTELAILKNEIISDIDGMKTDFGSSKKVSYSIPPQTQLCLFDLEKKEDIFENLPQGFNPLIIDSIRSNVRKNAFVWGNEIFEPFYLEIEINEPYFYCLEPVAGKVSFVIEGLGNRTLISINS